MVFVPSDSASGSESEEELNANEQPAPSREVAVNHSKQCPPHYEFTLDENTATGSIDKLNVSANNKDVEKLPAVVYKPRSGRLRPYPYISSTKFDQPSGYHEEVMPACEIERKLNSGFTSNTGLICLEEHSYIEFKPTHWPLERKTDFQHEPTSLGDLGPKFFRKVKTTDSEATTTAASKKKKSDKDKNKSKGEQSTDPLEEIDEKSKKIYSFCDSMPNILPPIRCFECKDWVKSSSFSRHVFAHIIQDKQAFPRENHNWCAHCNRCFKTDIDLRDHYMMVKRFGRYFCMFCIKKFKNTEKRFKHFRTHHFCQNTPYVCPVCPYKSSIEINFASHYVESHPLPICHLCHHLFPNARGLFFSNYRTSFDRQSDGYDLYREIFHHMMQHIHLGEKYACEKCTLTFISSADLISHEKATHTNIALNVKKSPLSHTGFAYRGLVVSGEALSQLEFYKNEDRLKKILAPYKRNVISASTTAHRKNGRKSENVEDSNNSVPGDLPEKVDTDASEMFKFKDCFFDTKSAAKCLQSDNFDVEAFYKNVKCNTCHLRINPSGENNGESAHFLKEPVRCANPSCTEVSYCRNFPILHRKYHEAFPTSDAGTDMVLPDQFPVKEDLMICSNCELSFDIYLTHYNHMKKIRHIGHYHSFKRDASDEKSQKRNQRNWIEEISKIQNV